MTEPKVNQQIQLPFRKAVQIAWKSLRVRWWRSLLVTSGIILSLAFLAYVLCSETLSTAVAANASPAMRQSLTKSGVTLSVASADTRAQTSWMVALALVVSFVGILNAMLMSVTERFAEIGTMKCLGALDSFIIKLFLLESLFQGVAGTLIGVTAGVALAIVEGLTTFGWASAGLIPQAEFVRIVGLCLASGAALTVAGSLYPAWRAAKMQPVDAMRSEV